MDLKLFLPRGQGVLRLETNSRTPSHDLSNPLILSEQFLCLTAVDFFKLCSGNFSLLFQFMRPRTWQNSHVRSSKRILKIDLVLENHTSSLLLPSRTEPISTASLCACPVPNMMMCVFQHIGRTSSWLQGS
jgi:hypothetical protein